MKMFKELTFVFAIIAIQSISAGLLFGFPATYSTGISAAAYTTAYATAPVNKFAATYAVPNSFVYYYAAHAPASYLKYATFPTRFTANNAALSPFVRYVTPAASYARAYVSPVPGNARYGASFSPTSYATAAFASPAFAEAAYRTSAIAPFAAW